MDLGYCMEYRAFLASQKRTMAEYLEVFGMDTDIKEFRG